MDEFKDELKNDNVHILSDSELFDLFEDISNEESIAIKNYNEIDEIDF